MYYGFRNIIQERKWIIPVAIYFFYLKCGTFYVAIILQYFNIPKIAVSTMINFQNLGDTLRSEIKPHT